MNKRKNRLCNRVLVVSVCVLVLALAALAFIVWNYWYEQQKYNEVENLGSTQSAALRSLALKFDNAAKSKKHNRLANHCLIMRQAVLLLKIIRLLCMNIYKHAHRIIKPFNHLQVNV